jgi:hypothetical protein
MIRRGASRQRDSSGRAPISAFKTFAAAAVIGLIPIPHAMAQTVITPGALEELRNELDALRADQTQRQDQIDRLQRRLDAFGAGIGDAPVIGEDVQADIRGRGLTPPNQPTATENFPQPAPMQPPAAQRAAAQPAAQTAPAPAPKPPAQPAATQPAAAPRPPVQQAAAAAPAEGADAGDDENIRREPARALSVDAVVGREQGFFGDRFSFELGMSYSHFDTSRLNLSGFLALDTIFLGRISIDSSSGDVFSWDASVRYGITPRLQVDVNVPALYRISVFQSGGAGGAASGLAEASVRASGLGDISSGISYRVLAETMQFPDLVFNARVKAPTGRSPYGIGLREVPNTQGNLTVPEKLGLGSGTWGFSVGASVLKTIDPLVVFGNISYFRNLPEVMNDISETTGPQPGTVDQGDSYQYGAGIAFAVNERASLSFSVTQRFVEKTVLRFRGSPSQKIINSDANVASINMGATFAITEKTSFIFNVGQGLTQDTPGFSFSARVPFAF